MGGVAPRYCRGGLSVPLQKVNEDVRGECAQTFTCTLFVVVAEAHQQLAAVSKWWSVAEEACEGEGKIRNERGREREERTQKERALCIAPRLFFDLAHEESVTAVKKDAQMQQGRVRSNARVIPLPEHAWTSLRRGESRKPRTITSPGLELKKNHEIGTLRELAGPAALYGCDSNMCNRCNS